MDRPADKRLGYVDCLRGFAAMAVVYYHTANHYRLAGEIANPIERGVVSLFTEFSDVGKIAVTLFFAVSGFVIPYSLFKPSRTPLRDFAITRFFRLYPAYWISIFIWVAFLWLARGEATPLERILVNLTMLQQFIGVQNVIELFWTLQIELIFYAICAALFAFGFLRSCRQIAWTSAILLVAALTLAAARWHYERKIPVALPLALSIMFWGFLWRRATVEKLAEARRIVAWLTALLFAAVLPICILAYSRDLGEHETWYRYADTYFIALAIFMLFTTRIKVAAPVAIYLGQISYSIYLFGPLGQEGAERLHPLLPAGWPISVTLLLAVALTLPISALVYHMVERPMIELGRHLLRRLKARDGATESLALANAGGN